MNSVLVRWTVWPVVWYRQTLAVFVSGGMGCFRAGKTDEDDEMRKEANRKIEKQLQKDKQAYRATHRLLLLGNRCLFSNSISVRFCLHLVYCKVTVHCEAKNCTSLFYFCNNFVKSLFIWIIIGTHTYPNKFETKWHQNHQSLLKGVFILPCEM